MSPTMSYFPLILLFTSHCQAFTKLSYHQNVISQRPTLTHHHVDQKPVHFLHSSSQSEDDCKNTVDDVQMERRKILQSIVNGAISVGTISSPYVDVANAADSTQNLGLASKLRKRDPSVLRNSVFNVPPSLQKYPKWMEGKWNVNMKFRGYVFPSTKIPQNKVVSNVNIPGFQKCSIAFLSDIGKESCRFSMNFNSDNTEDRIFDYAESINAHLGYSAVNEVLYDPKSNPNRLSVEFIKSQTRNAERIELFCNARESELVLQDYNNNNDGKQAQQQQEIFVCSEYIRQVTFSLSQEFNVARQVNGNYAHFFTWRQPMDDNGNTMTGNVLTAAYLDPQDPMFFDEPSKPVAVYSHDIVATRS